MGVSFAAKLRRGSTRTCSAACLVVLISNVFAYHLRVQKAVTANAAVPLVVGENVRSPLGAFRVVFGIRHFNKACMGCSRPVRVGSRLVALVTRSRHRVRLARAELAAAMRIAGRNLGSPRAALSAHDHASS